MKLGFRTYLFLSVAIVGLSILILLGLSLSASSSTTVKTLVTGAYDQTIYDPGVKMTRECTGRQWFFWMDRCGSDYYLNATYSDDEWATQNNVTIAMNYDSWTNVQVYDALTTSNGSVIVLTTQNKPNVYSIGMWIHYGPRSLSSWTYVSVYTSASTEMLSPDFAINDTDIILIIYYAQGSTIYTKEYNFINGTLDPTAIQPGTIYATSAYNQQVFVKSNSTGEFWVCYGWDAGSHINIRDYKKTRTNQVITNLGFESAIGEFQILPNDAKVIPVSWVQGSVQTLMGYWYENGVHNGTYSHIWIDGATGGPYLHARPYSSFYYGNYLYIYWNNTIDNRLECVGPCLWNASESAWQTTKVTLWNFSDDYWLFPQNGASDIWPKINGVSFQIPLGGFYIPINDQRREGFANFFKDKKLILSSYLHWADTNNLTITTTDIPYALVNRNYITQILQTGGNAPFEWVIDLGPSGLYIDSNGWLYGKINQTGIYYVLVSCHDISGRWDSANFTLNVYTRAPSTTPSHAYSFFYPDRGCWSALFVLVLLVFFIVWINYYLERG